jgi:hypothetical protein
LDVDHARISVPYFWNRLDIFGVVYMKRWQIYYILVSISGFFIGFLTSPWVGVVFICAAIILSEIGEYYREEMD